MKKKIFAIAIAATSLIAMSANAQQTECRKHEKCPTTERCEKKCDKKCDKKGDKKCCKKACANPFEGLNLTDAQKTKLKAINCPAKVMMEAKKRGIDKDVNPRDFYRSVRTDYLKQVKAVLSSDQYVKFLENAFVNQAPKHQGMKPDNRKDKKDCKGHKCEHKEKATKSK